MYDITGFKCTATEHIFISISLAGASLALKEDFLDEIKLMIEIGNHPHLMSVIGCCTLSEPYYLITEYMKYGALDKFLLRGRAVSLPQYRVCVQCDKMLMNIVKKLH